MKKMTNLAAAVLSAVLLTTIVSCSNAADSPSSPAATTTNTGNGQPGTPGNNQPQNQAPAQYKVNISTSIANGSVTASASSVIAGTEITLTATPAQGYLWSSYTVTASGGTAISVSSQGKFTMPASDVTVSATFVEGVTANLSNLASVVSALTQDTTIALTGQVTSSDFETIKNAIAGSQKKIKLDLRGVTGLDSLPEEAFSMCDKLQSLFLPEGLTLIGRCSLQGCSNLESIALPASFYSFEDSAIDTCHPSVFASINVAEGNLFYSSVDGVLFSKDKKTLVKYPTGKSGVYTVPAGVTQIEEYAFTDCRFLTSVALPDTLQEIGLRAFFCAGLEGNLTIPASVVALGEEFINGNSNLTSLTFASKENWISADSAQFRARSGGTTVTSTSLENNRTNATNFKQASNGYYYKTITTSDNVTAFAQRVAALTQDSTESLTGQINSTDIHAIYNAIDSINDVSVKVKLDMSGVTGLSSLPKGAFDSCRHLQEIILPEGIVSVGDSAFCACSDLERVSIPASVRAIGIGAFSYSLNLISVNVAEGNEVYSSVDGVLFNKDKTTLIYYPRAKNGAYSIPNGVKVIAKEAFRDCSNLTGITIPSGVERIETWAFQLTGIESLVVPDSVTVIDQNAFGSCSALKTARLSANLEKIERSMFSGCTDLESVEIPNGVKTICDSAFTSCVKLQSLSLPNTLVSIEGSVFQYCRTLSSLVIPASVTSISCYEFTGCTAFTSLTFEDPNGWIRANYSQWRQRSGGSDAEFIVSGENPPPQNPSQIASWFKTEYASSYWYKNTRS